MLVSKRAHDLEQCRDLEAQLVFAWLGSVPAGDAHHAPRQHVFDDALGVLERQFCDATADEQSRHLAILSTAALAQVKERKRGVEAPPPRDLARERDRALPLGPLP